MGLQGDSPRQGAARRALLRLLVAAFAWAWCAQAVTPVAARAYTVKVIAHPSVPAEQLGEAELRALFTRTQKRWNDGSTAIPLNLTPGTPERDTFDQAVLHVSGDDVAKFWIDQRIRGKGMPPRQVPDQEMMARVVAALPGAIGYVHATFVPRGVRVLATIEQGKVLPP